MNKVTINGVEVLVYTSQRPNSKTVQIMCKTEFGYEYTLATLSDLGIYLHSGISSNIPFGLTKKGRLKRDK